MYRRVSDPLLITAILDNDVDRVRILMQRSVNPETIARSYGDDDLIIPRDYTALQLACRLGHIEIVEILINHGSDVRKENDLAIRLAFEYRYYHVVRLLLEKINLYTQK
jgi:ankyrin repeat protein